MLKLALLLVFVSFAQGCAPGTGTLGTKATFQFDMFPGIAYTYCDGGCTAYPQIDLFYAKNKVRTDVQNSINQVLQANSIPLNDVNPPVVTYTPPNISWVESSSCEDTTVTQGLVSGQTIFDKCTEPKTGEFAKERFTQPLTVQVTAISAIYQSQWDSLASQVEDKMRALNGADFYADPVVTVSN